MNWPGDTLLAYIAGLIDGESYIGAKRRRPTKANRMRSPKYSVAFFIAMTDRRPVQLVADFCNAGHAVRSRQRKANYKTIYEFELENERAAALLRQVRPYIVGHAEQVDLALQMQALRDSSVGRRNKAKLPVEYVAACDAIYSRLKRISPRSGQPGAWS